jgi:hypothetical protein
MSLLLSPLLEPEHSAPEKATQLECRPCLPEIAREAIALWHSRLPKTQRGPWMLAFVAHYQETAFAAALWHNPSARTLPDDWLELRRMAVAPDAPHCTASWMLARMQKWIHKNRPEVTRLISYQDEEVHTGTIYRAAGWEPAHRTKARSRDRSKNRKGSRRAYRSNLNGASPDGAGKVRWESALDREGEE